MQKILSATIALAMLMLLTPAATASESVSSPYTGGMPFVTTGVGLMCPDFCLGDLEENNPMDGQNFGGAHLTASTFYNNVIVSIADDFYGSEGGFSVCFFNPEGDNICDSEEDYRTGVDCGTRALTGSPFAGDYVTVFIYSVTVTADLDVCGASSGTLTGSFF